MATLTPGGYTWVGGRHDPIRKINPHNRAAINRANRRATGSIGGGGRSNLDAAQGRSRQGVTTPRFAQQTYGGGEGRGGQGNILRNVPGHHPSHITRRGKYSTAPGGISDTGRGQEFIMKTDDEIIEKGSPAFDHKALDHLGPWLKSLPMPRIMGGIGDLAKGAMRGSRLHSDYKDRAVAAGGTKAEGSKAWEADKRAMMTADEREFEKKYLKLASLATDNERQRNTERQLKRRGETSRLQIDWLRQRDFRITCLKNIQVMIIQAVEEWMRL